jgi:hypothetical protein
MSCFPFPNAGIAVWNPSIFLTRYPAFSSVNPSTLAAYFNEAGLYLNNTPCSPVYDLTRRQLLLNMLVAHLSYLNGDLEVTSIAPVPPDTQLAVTSPTAGTFAVAHDLGLVPQALDILMTSAGAMWQSAPSDATNIYLGASDVNLTATVSVFQTVQVASAAGSVRPVGRVTSASEGSVSVSFDYGTPTPGSGAWFQQSQYGAAFWQATSSLRGMRYIRGLTWIR